MLSVESALVLRIDDVWKSVFLWLKFNKSSTCHYASNHKIWGSKPIWGIKIRAVYSSCKVGDFFSLKSVAPSSLSANVVYKFTCSLDARTSYIGKTERHLVARMEEYLNPKKDSAVTKHISQCITCYNNASFDNFSIIQRCQSALASIFHETLCIRRYKPSLNIQLPNNGGSVLAVF